LNAGRDGDGIVSALHAAGSGGGDANANARKGCLRLRALVLWRLIIGMAGRCRAHAMAWHGMVKGDDDDALSPSGRP